MRVVNRERPTKSWPKESSIDIVPVGGRSSATQTRPKLFDNLPELLKPEAVASLMGISVKTIYDWHYRRRLKKVPDHLFLKFNRLLYLRTDVLREWIIAQNPTDVGRMEHEDVS